MGSMFLMTMTSESSEPEVLMMSCQSAQGAVPSRVTPRICIMEDLYCYRTALKLNPDRLSERLYAYVHLRLTWRGTVAVHRTLVLPPSTQIIGTARPQCHTMVITGEEELKTEEKFDDSIPPLSVELKSYGFPHGYFMLRCIGAARILDVARGSIEDGTDVILWPPTDSSQVECESISLYVDAILTDRCTSHEEAGI